MYWDTTLIFGNGTLYINITFPEREISSRGMWLLTEAQARLIIIFRGMIFSTITHSGKVIFILLYHTEHSILYLRPFFSLRPTMVRGVPKGMHE